MRPTHLHFSEHRRHPLVGVQWLPAGRNEHLWLPRRPWFHPCSARRRPTNGPRGDQQEARRRQLSSASLCANSHRVDPRLTRPPLYRAVFIVCLLTFAPYTLAQPTPHNLQIELHPYATVALPEGSRLVDLPPMRINGLPIKTQLIILPLPPRELFTWIQKRLPPALIAHRHANTLFIYTAEGNRSWVLSVRYKQSEQHAQKTTLSVFSELVFNVHGFIATTSPPSSLAWFDANLATHLSAQSMDEGNLSHQLIYSHPTWDISELQRRMADGLSKAGWHTDVGSVGALSFWRQGSRRLMTALVSMQNGSAVFVSLQEGTGPLRQIETHSAKRRPSPLRPLGGSAQR